MNPTDNKRYKDIYFNAKEEYYYSTPRMDELQEDKFLDFHNINSNKEESYLNGSKIDKELLLESKILDRQNNNLGYYASPKLIECSIQFIQIGEVDTMNERYQAVVEIKAKWYDDEIIENYDPKKHWNPKLFIENASYDKNIEEINYSVSKYYDRTLITETRIAKGTFWERMELRDFPVDIQELTICLSTKHNSRVCKLIPDSNKFTVINNQKYSALSEQVIKTFRDQQKFFLYKLVTFSDKASYDADSKYNASFKQYKHKFVAVVKCSRRSTFYIINAYLFNLLITILSMTLFAIEAKIAQTRLSGTFTLILTSFSFKVVTSKSLPTIAYLTSLDRYQLINIVYLVVCCIWHSFCASINIESDRKYELDKLALYFLATIFGSIQIFFIVYLTISHKKVFDLKKRNERLLSQLDPIILEGIEE